MLKALNGNQPTTFGDISKDNKPNDNEVENKNPTSFGGSKSVRLFKIIA